MGDKDLVQKLSKSFDEYAYVDGDCEYWYARDLMGLLGYSQWRNFEEAIKRAIMSCESTEIPVENHFADVSKMVSTGSGAERGIADFQLTRYACYLIAMNGDPRKDEIAFAQSYFAVQTRKQEVIVERMSAIRRISAREKLTESEKRLSQNIYERGVDDKGFARIRSRGDTALFGGDSTQKMKDRLGVKSGPLADVLPAVTIAAKNLATEMTNHNVEEQDMYGEWPIGDEHVQNNESVRGMLGTRGIKPEELPSEEDIKKLKRRVRSDEKRLGDGAKALSE
ncbi:MAG: DNA damage-inducible protein D [Coriobacteriia bacterium]|nr:DNA damage-inducible protein D [Coriobacteriia bacterium]